MELPNKVQSYLRVDSSGFLICSGKDHHKIIKSLHQVQGQKIFEQIIDKLGALSAKSQGLKQIITSVGRFLGYDHRIYIKVKENKVFGFLKVGQKKLFYRDYLGNIKQLNVTCVLDIYVHQSCQRSGVGKEIFSKFLEVEKKSPQKLAYDRPSQKLLCFLKKHYHLAKYIPQNNNYVIYDRYFDKNSEMKFAKKQEEKPTFFKEEEQIENISLKNNQMKKLNNTLTSMSISEQKQKKQTKELSFQMGVNKITKHKNVTSQDFPLFTVTSYENPIFRTTSASYGNYYKKK